MSNISYCKKCLFCDNGVSYVSDWYKETRISNKECGFEKKTHMLCSFKNRHNDCKDYEKMSLFITIMKTLFG